MLKALSRLVTAHGMPPLTFHGLRHTCASVLLSAGLPMSVVWRMLGHSSIGISVDTYGHLVMDVTTRDAVDRALAGFQARRGPIPGAHPGIRRLTAVVERSA